MLLYTLCAEDMTNISKAVYLYKHSYTCIVFSDLRKHF